MKHLILILLLIFSFAPMSLANEKAPANDDFANLPILFEGRIIPLDIFAAAKLENYAGKNHIATNEAISIFADIVFNPAQGADRKIFSLRNESLRTRFNITQPRGEFFSLAELQPHLDDTRPDVEALLARDQSSLNKDERALLALHDNAAGYLGLMRSLSLILPLNVDVPARYGEFTDQDDISYLDLARRDAQIMNDLKAIIKEKGEDFTRYNEGEQQIALLAYDLGSIRAGGALNELLRIMPIDWQASDQIDFQSPWQMILSGQGSPENAAYLTMWQEVAAAYRAADAQDWAQKTAAAHEAVQARLGHHYPVLKFTLERSYHNLQPYSISAILYALSLAMLIIYAVKSSSLAFLAAKITAAGAILSHSAGIALRVIILDRPPVGTLYESVLFVAVICAGIGLALSFKKQGGFALLCGTFSALGLLMIAPFIAGDNQTLGVLAAVLNTNFWLATHVLCITIGYGICVMAALCGHGFLVVKIWPALADKISAETMLQMTYRFSLAALLFTTVGTILGGIWADQSWGRFWGWDPKENGALLIVLWLIWLQHGRLSGHINPTYFAAGMAFLNVIVALAWFGVNLLSVGLHSYGFTSGLAWGLGLFCVGQIMIILLLLFGQKIKTIKYD